jgi:DNA polymerase III delta prime subunit
MSYIWYEKYRPHSLEEMELPETSIKVFTKFISDGKVPHLMFYGPPGGGKTTVVKIILDLIPNQSLRLNGSSERSIDIMRDQVQKFASSMPLPGKQKIVFIDEADGLLSASQKQLKGLIEKYANSCSFIFTANEPGRFIEAILSRFISIAFKAIDKGTILKHLVKILNTEKIKFSIMDLNTLTDLYFPDIRTIINNMQLCSVGSVLDLIHLQELEEANNFLEVSEAIIKGNLKGVRELIAGQHYFQSYYKQLFDKFIYSIPEEVRPSIAVTIAESMYKDNLCIDKEINFASLCIELMHILNCKKIIF